MPTAAQSRCAQKCSSNASKVSLNWLLSKEGQSAFTKALDSRRGVLMSIRMTKSLAISAKSYDTGKFDDWRTAPKKSS